ncbi:membrane protein AbrB duplication [Ancylobacter novellus DSM 506]|uniref:Membrane protein AbrB duplication n=1 Tax=Ancylobacter novellus (strain ATCC 8093 / DSM 506 / JCM 20403 / CCM 1077 / IAM 12100 / NBRC 12443 / NCIMB 10456) TaxID=639283 RepID=D7A9X9_ANCN5|nr:AbrB family transcriptional regulator [Ancylobacter novellus]ADH88905.1 membrane protein AbrB duplication [Ancylobacter novellus DSM 506]
MDDVSQKRVAARAERHPPGKWWLRVGLTYASAVAAGYVASRLHVPLPWMLGPLFVCGTLMVLGVPLQAAPHMREIGQVIVGLAIGMRFTPALLLVSLELLPAMLAATCYIITATFVGALIMRPIARIDPTTAFFATAAGGMADMAVVAAARGGDTTAVSIVHALRVTTVVSVVPFLVFAFGEQGTINSVDAGAASDLPTLLLGLAVAYLGARLLRPTVIPNPWLLGSLLPSAALGASGLLSVVVPGVMIIAAQVMIGVWLAMRFRRDLFVRLPRVAFGGLVVALLLVAAAGLGAEMLSLATGLPMTTSFLALAPAAITEMVLTAKAMHADAELVTAFHIVRIAVIASTILLVFRVYRYVLRGYYGSRV